MFFFKGDRPHELLDQLSTAGTIGLNLVSSTFIGMAMGWLLDKWLGTKPWLLFFMLFMGIVAGFRNVIHEVQRIQQAGEKSDNDAKGDGDKKDDS